MWAHVQGECNQETWDPQLAEEYVVWWKADECPIAGCKHFKNAKAWSFIGEEKVIAYMKYHLVFCSADNHRLDADAACAALEDVVPIMDEWKMADRKQWVHDQEMWVENEEKREAAKRRKTEQKEAEEARRAANGGSLGASVGLGDELPAREFGGGVAPPTSPPPGSNQVIMEIATQVASQLLAAGFNPKAPMPERPTLGPPIMFPPSGLPPSAPPGMPPVGRGPLPLPPMGGDSQLRCRVPRLQLLTMGQLQALLDSLGRSEAAMRASMQQCITNARNIHNEIAVVEEGIAAVRSAMEIV